MKIRKTQRLAALVLSCLMLLPLISIPAFAASPTVYWMNDFDGTGDLSTWFSGKPSTAQIYDNNGNQAVGFEIKGVGNANYTAKYYAYNNRKVYEVTGLTEHADGTVSGTFTVNGTSYSFTNQPVDNGTNITTTPSLSGYRIYTPAMIDAMDGAVNVAAPLKAKNDAVTYNSKADKIAFEIKLYFPVGSVARDMAGRAKSADGKNVELYGLKVSANTVTVTLHENVDLVSGVSAATVPTGQWFTLTTVVDTTKVQYDVYLNGTYVYTAKNKSISPAANFGIRENSWELLQINRNNSNANMLAGYVMIDDAKIYDGSAFSHQSKYREDNMEGHTLGSAITTASGYNQADTGTIAPYNKVLADTDGNQFVRVPFIQNTSTDTNSDKTLMPGSESFTGTDEFFIYEASYRPHLQSGSATIEAQIRRFSFDLTVAAGATDGGVAVTEDKTVTNGQYLQLFQLDVATGALKSQYAGFTTTGAAGLVKDEWNTVRIIFNLTNGMSLFYVNDELYGTVKINPQYYSGGWKLCTNATNFQFNQNNLIAVKVNKNKTYTTTDAAGENYTNANYVDADNVKSYAMTAEEVAELIGSKETRDDYESYDVGTKLTVSNGYNKADTGTIAPYNKVLADADGNKFVRLPILYDGVKNGTNCNGGVTNFDKNLMPGNAMLTADDDFMVFDVSYRPHGNVTTASQTIEVQIRNFEFDLSDKAGSTDNGNPVTGTVHKSTGLYLQLFQINLNTGEINNTYGMKKTGAAGLVQDEWNDIRFVLNLKDTSANLFVNGLLYGTIERMKPVYSSNGWKTCTNPINLTVPKDSIIAAKCNKINDAFMTESEANADYSNVNYIDMDDYRVYPMAAEDVADIPSVNENGEMLMYVQLGTQRVGNEILYISKDSEYSLHYFDPAQYANIVSTVGLTSMRISSPGGLRFAHQVDLEKLDALHALINNGLSDVTFGTLIVPEDYLADGTLQTKDALTAAGKKYLDIRAYYNCYYSFDDDPTTTHFVGSIVNILEHNVERNFAAIGYVEVTLMSGLTYIYYSDTTHVANVKETAGKILANTDMSGWNNSSKKIVETYAAGQSLTDMMAQDLNGLNVLALGDSLFAGNDLGWGVGCVRENQWVNLMGKKYNWNLTNLGIGGMTVSQTDNNATTGKASMYQWFFNGLNDYHWNTAADRIYVSGEADRQQNEAESNANRYYNKYFQIGDFEGKTNEDVDLIILEGGCNDYGTAIAAPLGTVGSTDGGTFIGAYKAIADKLMEMYPNAKIVFITTWRLGNQSRPNDTLTSIEYSESVIDLYNQCYKDNDRVCLIDAGNPAVSGIDMLDNDFVAKYSNDRYHLKDNGMAIMESHMMPRIWQFLIDSKK